VSALYDLLRAEQRQTMAWVHTYVKESHILLVTVTGLVDRRAWETQLRASISEAVSHSCFRFLVDYRQADLQLGLIDLYERPSYYEEAGMPHSARIAILFAPGTKDTEFVETVTSNRGYAVKTFADRDEAVDWLTRP
jgi:SpoIIAA-like